MHFNKRKMPRLLIGRNIPVDHVGEQHIEKYLGRKEPGFPVGCQGDHEAVMGPQSKGSLWEQHQQQVRRGKPPPQHW